jgi:2-polyprenyl-6-methoxyphenol hydroxylase-like FAD-dependent oxidoreductase
MQLRHPHFFRSPVRQVLQDAVPDVWDALLAAGGVPALPAGLPPSMTGLQCRRSTFERTLWGVAAMEPGLSLRSGHVDALAATGGRVTGVVVDGATVEADLVVCATGRGSVLGDDLRAPGEESDCGFSYVARMYRARPGFAVPDTGLPLGALYDGYLAVVFAQDDQTLSALVIRPTPDEELAELRHNTCFDTAAQLIPNLATWTSPERFEPITDAMAGGRLTNSYRGQLDERGAVPVAGVFFVGDAVSTTNPAAGRGVSLGLRQAERLMSLVEERDPRDAAEALDAWCLENVKPWYDDHVHWDETLLRRLAGEDIDPEARISSDVICAAAQQDPSLMPVVGPFLAMMTLPTSLAAVEDRVRELLRSGWRPPFDAGPSRAEVVDAISQPVPVG